MMPDPKAPIGTALAPFCQFLLQPECSLKNTSIFSPTYAHFREEILHVNQQGAGTGGIFREQNSASKPTGGPLVFLGSKILSCVYSLGALRPTEIVQIYKFSTF